MTQSLVAYSPHALLIGFGEGGGHIILIFQRFAFFVVDMLPLCEVNWLSFVVILRIVSGELEL